MDLSGRTVLVTGSNRGIGRAIVEELAGRDARLLAGMRDPGEFEAVRGGDVRPVGIDLSSPERIDACLAELGDSAATIDVLVNNAGHFAGGLLERQELPELYETIQVNLAGLVHLTRALLPHMLRRGDGKIVNNASIAAYAHFPGAAVYSATKAGVAAFSDALRRELDETGVGVLQIVTPGVETDMLEQVREEYDPHLGDASKIEGIEPAEWAAKIAGAIEADDELLNPTGAERLAKLASRGPAGVLDSVLSRAFDR
jgi:NAD(P)-dependent dehydrogenase (short-subunit alcohol dehydrogenase family)